MSYSNKILAAANKTILERKKLAENTHSLREEEISKKIPEISRYEKQLAATGLSVAKALSMGEDAEKYIRGLSEINLEIQASIKNSLKLHGYPENYLDIPYTCKICNDIGFVEGKFCECRKQLLKEYNKAELEMVSPAADCRFDNFDLNYYSPEYKNDIGQSPRDRMSDILQFCKEYSDDFDKKSQSILMYGATGLGKTHLSLSIANSVVEKGYNVKYVSAQNLFTALENERFNRDKYSTPNANIGAEVMDTDLLIIDDLGSEFSTTFTVSELYNIINTRINLSKPIIISTNLVEEELEKRYTQRITSRIIGNYAPLLFSGNDIRQIKLYED